MKFIGVDLHKKTISVCVVVVDSGKRQVARRRRFDCQDTLRIREFFEQQTDRLDHHHHAFPAPERPVVY